MRILICFLLASFGLSQSMKGLSIPIESGKLTFELSKDCKLVDDQTQQDFLNFFFPDSSKRPKKVLFLENCRVETVVVDSRSAKLDNLDAAAAFIAIKKDLQENGFQPKRNLAITSFGRRWFRLEFENVSGLDGAGIVLYTSFDNGWVLVRCTSVSWSMDDLKKEVDRIVPTLKLTR